VTRDEHLRRMYAMGTTTIGNKPVMRLACSACSNADLRADGIDLLAVLRAADHHITVTGSQPGVTP
jgi:hypothetical protein